MRLRIGKTLNFVLDIVGQTVFNRLRELVLSQMNNKDLNPLEKRHYVTMKIQEEFKGQFPKYVLNFALEAVHFAVRDEFPELN
jgi:hypothetical protein